MECMEYYSKADPSRKDHFTVIFHFLYKFLVWLGFEIPSENLENSDIELVQYVSDIALKWLRKLKPLKVLLSTLEWCSNNTLDEEAKLYKH